MAHDSLHLERTTVNAARFRRVNERIAAEAFSVPAAWRRRCSFLCECVVSECTDEVQLDRQEYLHVRSSPAWFLVAPHHEMAMGDRVVETHDRYWIVEKLDEAREVAEAELRRGIPPAEQEESRELMRAVNAARWQEHEYQHALDHYVALMRHRLANPLTAIIGLTQALVDMPELDEETRARIARAVHEQSRLLLSVSLDPRAISCEEEVLEPAPFQRFRANRRN